MPGHCDYIGVLLSDLVELAPASDQDCARLVVVTIAQQLDVVIGEARQAGFAAGVLAMQRAAGEVERAQDALDDAKDAAERSMAAILDRFMAMTPDVQH